MKKGPKGFEMGQRGFEGPEGVKFSPKQIALVEDILHSMDTPSVEGIKLEAKKRFRRHGFILLNAILFFVIGVVMYLFSESGVVVAWVPVPFFLVSIGVCIYSSYLKYF